MAEPRIDDVAGRAARLRALHRPGTPLLLPNAWDVPSARAVAKAGFDAVATSSGAVADALGFDDEERAPVEDMLAAAERIARAVDVPVSVDAEAGYGLSPDVLVSRLVAIGAAGCNLEDSDHRTGGRRDRDTQAAYLAAVRSAAHSSGAPLVINARIDTFLADDQPTDAAMRDAIDRARTYLDAGAECVYPIRLADERAIADFITAVAAPVNIYLRPGAPPIARLRELGVARISMGGWLQRLVVGRLEKLLARIAADADPFAADDA